MSDTRPPSRIPATTPRGRFTNLRRLRGRFLDAIRTRANWRRIFSGVVTRDGRRRILGAIRTRKGVAVVASVVALVGLLGIAGALLAPGVSGGHILPGGFPGVGRPGGATPTPTGAGAQAATFTASTPPPGATTGAQRGVVVTFACAKALSDAGSAGAYSGHICVRTSPALANGHVAFTAHYCPAQADDALTVDLDGKGSRDFDWTFHASCAAPFPITLTVAKGQGSPPITGSLTFTSDY